MGLNIVRNSFMEYIKSSLNYDITYDNRDSEIKDITGLNSKDNIFYTGTAITELTLNNYGMQFTTDESLIGRLLQIDTEGIILSDEITEWDKTTGKVKLKTGFKENIFTDSKISILSDILIFIKTPHSMLDKSTRLCNARTIVRFDLYIKIRKDNDGVRMYALLEELRDMLLGNNLIFNLKDNGKNLGYANINSNTYSENELLDISEDMNIYLVSFTVSYNTNYK